MALNWITCGIAPMLDKKNFPGKIDDVQTYQLDFWISPVIVVDHEIYYAKQIQRFFGSELDYKLPFFSEMSFKIYLDQDTVFDTKFSELDTLHVTKMINDLECKNHELTFVLQGKNNNHSCFLGEDKKSVTLSVQLDFKIEDLPTTTLFYQHGKYITDEHQVQSAATIMGINGKQVIQLPSPIYPWLLENNQCIISDFVRIQKEKSLF
jgi:hypothetical protein